MSLVFRACLIIFYFWVVCYLHKLFEEWLHLPTQSFITCLIRIWTIFEWQSYKVNFKLHLISFLLQVFMVCSPCPTWERIQILYFQDVKKVYESYEVRIFEFLKMYAYKFQFLNFWVPIRIFVDKPRYRQLALFISDLLKKGGDTIRSGNKCNSTKLYSVLSVSNIRKNVIWRNSTRTSD